MLIQQNAVLFLAVSLPALVMCGVPHSHGVKKGHAEREDDGAYRFLATFSYRIIHNALHSIILKFPSSPRDSGHAGDSETFDHEAILGSAREAEEFDSLPPEEAKAKLAALIKKMYRDQDNRISKKVRLEQYFKVSYCSTPQVGLLAHLSFLTGFVEPPR